MSSATVHGQMGPAGATVSGEMIEISPDAIMLALGEQLMLQWPAVEHVELWRQGFQYYFAVGAIGPDLHVVESWANERAQIAMPPFDVVRAPPDGAVLIPGRDMLAVVELRGAFRNTRDVYTDLALGFGTELPAFYIKPIPYGVELHFEVGLSREQIERVHGAVQALDVPLRAAVIHPSTPAPGPAFERWPQGDVQLIPSRGLPAGTPRQVRRLVEVR